MTRTQYRAARRLLRANGRYALRWMDDATRAVFDVLCAIQDAADPLAERASIVAWCRREGIACNVRQTARGAL